MMKSCFRFFLAVVCTTLLSVDQAAAFTTKGMPARMQATTPSSSVLKVFFREVDTALPKPQKKKMTKAQKDQIIQTKLFGSAVLSAALYLGSAFTGMAALTASPEPAFANDSKVVGQLKGSGLVFKDTLSIERFEDPKVKGVVLYISNFDRPVTEKFSKGNFFNDPSYASVACARTGQKVAVASNINKTPQGEEVFEESRSLLFKTLRVQRVYDEEKQ
jgi:catabolite regulation protein CreA